MNKQIIVLFSIFALAALASSQDIEVVHPLFDLNEMYAQGTLDAFLKASNGNEIYLIECPGVSNPDFKITKMDVTPKFVVKGKDFKLKVGGVIASEHIKIKGLHLDVFYNGATIHNEDVAKVSDAKKGPYFFDYTNTVPTFTPSGHWETFVYLRDEKDVNLACVKATFDI